MEIIDKNDRLVSIKYNPEDCILVKEKVYTEDQYEQRLKADLEAILKDLQLEIEELPKIHPFMDYPDDNGYIEDSDIRDLIQQKITNLQVNNSKVKEQTDGKD